MNSSELLGRPLTSLTGAGNQIASLFAKLGIQTLWDLLLHLPIRYEDRSHVEPIASLTAGKPYLIRGCVEYIDVLPRGKKSLICQIKDHSGSIHLRFFHFTARLYQQLKPGTQLLCYGEVRPGYHGLEIIHPDYKVISADENITPEPILTPVYSLTQGLNQKVARKLINQALRLLNENSQFLNELIPDETLNDLQLPALLTTFNTLHNPENTISPDTLTGNQSMFRKRLAIEELLAHHLSVKSIKMKTQTWHAPKIKNDPSLAGKFIASLPFTLTAAQLKVISEITDDFQRHHPMMRLVQGDVGSGKTIVAADAALLAVSSGYQVAIMAPTELLAEQHYRNFSQWFSGFSTFLTLLTSQIKNQQRAQIKTGLSDGTINIVIGTHALFQEDVVFHRLGLVIIDEQHRFGVHQRLALRAKGQQENIRPHQLIMTATPIPRTLAMLQYADLDISVIDQLPPGRKPVHTSVIPSERRDEVVERIDHWVNQKKQVYWVCTLIEESEILQCEAAEITALRLAEMLPNVNVGLLHGRMKSVNKDAVMQAFKNQEIDLLVATTVIEVGVDVPNANLMIIENPERLGLSQLHQLRGRVGRGTTESYCLLLYQSPLSENARQRLGILRDSQDGFVIAEKDLQLRGPGEVLGTRQTGQINFKIADLVNDAELLDNIPTIADFLLKQRPDVITPIIERWLGRSIEYFEV